MKKSLIALAILGGFAGAAAAQSSVTLYGIADVGVQSFDNGRDRLNGLRSGIQSGSRIGFRGTEDLGGGLSAIFTLENGFNINNGTFADNTRLFNRQAFVGLNSGLGSIKLGRQYAPIRPALELIDPFALGLAGNAESHFNTFGARTDNTINYTTPDFSGFTGQLAYSFGNVAGNNTAGRQIGLSGTYKNGPINAVLAYHRANGTVTTTGTPAVTLDQSGLTTRATLIGATYDFGVAMAHAAFAWNKGDVGVANPGLQDSRDWMLGVSAPFGASKVLASYMRRNDRSGNDAGTHTWALGYTYDLSKRTNLYTSYSRTNNDPGSNLGIGGPSAAPGLNNSWFNAGIRHRF